MARTYSVRAFDATGIVELGGATAAYRAAAATLADQAPPDHRLVQLTEVAREVEVDSVKISFVALFESV